jgi:type I restriction enzyme, R subunit
VRLTFNQVATDKLQDLVDSNFKFYKQVTDNEEFAEYLMGFLFRRYLQRTAGPTATQ